MLKTPKEIAEEYGFAASYIRKMIRQGHIKAEKLGKFYAIDPSKLQGLKRRRYFNRVKKDDNHGSNQ